MNEKFVVPDIDIILKGLRSQDHFLRKTAIESVGRYNLSDKRIVSALQDIAFRDSNMFVKQAATDMLLNFKNVVLLDGQQAQQESGLFWISSNITVEAQLAIRLVAIGGLVLTTIGWMVFLLITQSANPPAWISLFNKQINSLNIIYSVLLVFFGFSLMIAVAILGLQVATLTILKKKKGRRLTTNGLLYVSLLSIVGTIFRLKDDHYFDIAFFMWLITGIGLAVGFFSFATWLFEKKFTDTNTGD